MSVLLARAKIFVIYWRPLEVGYRYLDIKILGQYSNNILVSRHHQDAKSMRAGGYYLLLPKKLLFIGHNTAELLYDCFLHEYH